MNEMDKRAGFSPPNGRASLPYLIIYYALQLGGAAFLAALLSTALLSKGVQRHSSLCSFFFIWAVTSFLNAMLAWSGNARNDKVTTGWKIASAVTYLCGLPLLAASALGMMFKIWSVVMKSTAGKTFGTLAEKLANNKALLAFPWLATLPTLFTALPYALKNVDKLARSDFFYVLQGSKHHDATVLFSNALIFLTVVGAAWTAFAYAYWRKAHFVSHEGTINQHVVLRMLAFSVMAALSFGIVMTNYLRRKEPPAPAMVVVGLIPCAAFVIFASQEDVLRSWHVPERLIPHISDFAGEASTFAKSGGLKPQDALAFAANIANEALKTTGDKAHKAKEGVKKGASQAKEKAKGAHKKMKEQYQALDREEKGQHSDGVATPKPERSMSPGDSGRKGNAEHGAADEDLHTPRGNSPLLPH